MALDRGSRSIHWIVLSNKSKMIFFAESKIILFLLKSEIYFCEKWNIFSWKVKRFIVDKVKCIFMKSKMYFCEKVKWISVKSEK